MFIFFTKVRIILHSKRSVDKKSYFCILFIMPLKTNTILSNLDAFIRKYYKSRLIKGLLYTIALLISIFLIAVVIEYFGYLSPTLRTIFFWSYILVALLIIIFYDVIPLTKMFRLGKTISYDEAARIIGNHFPEIQDKLLNLLQLQKLENASTNDLLLASIRQKTDQLSPFPFHQAVNLKANKRYVKYAAIPLAILLILLIIIPSFVTEPSKRFVNYSTFYEKPAPFAFVVENASLEVPQQDDFLLSVSIVGDAVPKEAFILIDGKQFRLQPKDKSHFSFLFKQVRQSLDFSLYAAGVTSLLYHLQVFPKPVVANFQVALSYPSYTALEASLIDNEGDLSVPLGTSIKWIFQTHDVDSLFFITDSTSHVYTPDAHGRVSILWRAMKSIKYAFFASNNKSNPSDTLSYSVSVIPDGFPSIAVLEMQDSMLEDRRFFQGRIKDDYGFSKLDFKLIVTNDKDSSSNRSITLPVTLKSGASQEFFFAYNFAELSIIPGDHIQYFFEVWDNDAINGPKVSSSQHFDIIIPTDEELQQVLDQNFDDAQKQAQQSVSELKKAQEEINELMRKLIDKKELNWQDKKQLQQLADMQKQIKESLSKMQQQLKENNRLEQKYREQNEQIMEKQRELDRLLNEVLNDEMKEMLQEIDKLMQEMDKKKVQEQLENIKLDNEQLEKQIDQNIDLMKHLEMEKKVQDAINKADNLAEKQRQLSDKTESSKKDDKESLQRQQEDLSKEFQSLKNDIKEIQKGYKEIEPNHEFKLDEELQKKIDDEQNEAQKQLNKGNKKEASKQQKSASDDLSKLSEQLAEQEMQMEQEDLAEDSEMIRRLLKNLVHLSFNQEGLISKVQSTYIQDPQYQKIILDQNTIKGDFRNVDDSLRAVAKRQINVASAITKELSEVNTNIAKSLSSLLEFNQTFYANAKNINASRSMQYSMTSLNNLALVLAESLDQMQNQMRQNQQQQQNGNCKRKCNNTKQGSCSKPGKGKPSAKSMKQMQDELNKQMESLKKQLDKQGNKPGRKRLGDKSGMSEEFAKMAAQQEMIRRMMQEYGQEIKQDNAGNGKLAREIDEMMRQMEQTETDLVNQTISQQTIRRQQQIMSRMLEHEKAEMQREKEERRQSHEATQQFQPSPADLQKFKKLQQSNTELFQSTPPTLSNFYKSKVDNYFYNFY